MPAFDWKDYLTFAKSLQTRTDEAALRSAISRAYYAVFCQARRRWEHDNGPVPLGVNVHEYIWKTYIDDRDRARQFIGRDGFRMRNFRTEADYEDSVSDLINTMKTTLTLAKKTLLSLDKL